VDEAEGDRPEHTRAAGEAVTLSGQVIALVDPNRTEVFRAGEHIDKAGSASPLPVASSRDRDAVKIGDLHHGRPLLSLDGAGIRLDRQAHESRFPFGHPVSFPAAAPRRSSYRKIVLSETDDRGPTV
jgi:hypothetical protein